MSLGLVLALLLGCGRGTDGGDSDDTDGGAVDGGTPDGGVGGDGGGCDGTSIQVPQPVSPEDGATVGSSLELVVRHDADYHELLSFTVIGPDGGVVSSTEEYEPAPGSTESTWPLDGLEPGRHGWFSAGRHDGCWSIGSPTWFFTVE